jgi:hypothetical protein
VPGGQIKPVLALSTQPAIEISTKPQRQTKKTFAFFLILNPKLIVSDGISGQSNITQVVMLRLRPICSHSRSFQFRARFIQQPSRILGVAVQGITVHLLRGQNRLVGTPHEILSLCQIRMNTRCDVARRRRCLRNCRNGKKSR